MSYNRRAPNPNFMMSKAYNNNVSNIGMRRSNFVHGGQLLAHNKPLVTMPMNQQQQQQQRHQQPQRPPPQQRQPPQQNQPPPPQQQVSSSPNQQNQVNDDKNGIVQQNSIETVAQQKEQETQQELQTLDGSDDVKMQDLSENNDASMNESSLDGIKKRPWYAGKNKKIAKKERLRRRNMRLYKILTPKNAVMVLNELVKNVVCTVSDDPQMSSEGPLYDACVVIDGKNYHGFGRTKALAKNYAAEAALKFLVKNKRFTIDEPKNEDNGERQDESTESMNVDVDETGLPWQQVASFALYKLFSSWGDDPTQISNSPMSGGTTNNDSFESNKPAKKMPANPEQMNPLMLLNQMLPNAKFEEMMKQGNAPNCIFTYQCNVDDEIFVGCGKNKKTAKKMAAFSVCHKVLGVQYPPEIYTPPN